MNTDSAYSNRNRYLSAVLAAVCAAVLTACGGGGDEADAGSISPVSSTSAVSTPADDSASPTAASAASAADPSADASKLLDAAAKSAAVMHSIHAEFSSKDVDNLLARSYSADVATQPQVASRGSADLKINGDYSQTDFRVSGGELWLTNADGTETDMGKAAGKFDPAVLLDPKRGVAALASTATDAKVSDPKATLDGKPAVKIAAQLPASSVGVLVPAEVIGDAKTLPATLWVIPGEPTLLARAVIEVGGGTVTLTVSKGDPFTVK